MTGGTNTSERCQMNQRCRNKSVGRTTGLVLLLGESRHRMNRRPRKYMRQSSCARVCENLKFPSASDEPLVRNTLASVHPSVENLLIEKNWVHRPLHRMNRRRNLLGNGSSDDDNSILLNYFSFLIRRMSHTNQHKHILGSILSDNLTPQELLCKILIDTQIVP
jgi:hypothetical protein